MIAVIGGGAAGMMAAISAAEHGAEVVLFERNPVLGKKVRITGKGRCNLTNACDTSEIFENIPTNGSFLYSAIYSFTNFDVIDFFEHEGVKTKVERGERVFPVSDKASDIVDAMHNKIKALNIKVVNKIKPNIIYGIQLARQEIAKKASDLFSSNGVRVKGLNFYSGCLGSFYSSHIRGAKNASIVVKITEKSY